jgi:hypothetical protein
MQVICKQGVYEMPETVSDAYRRLYPTADDEFARMAIWLERNVARRPASPKSAPRFVDAWFKRVPRRAAPTVRDQRAATFAALIGGAAAIGDTSNVVELSASAVRVGGADIRAIGHGVRGAESVGDVGWRQSREG